MEVKHKNKKNLKKKTNDDAVFTLISYDAGTVSDVGNIVYKLYWKEFLELGEFEYGVNKIMKYKSSAPFPKSIIQSIKEEYEIILQNIETYNYNYSFTSIFTTSHSENIMILCKQLDDIEFMDAVSEYCITKFIYHT